MARGRTERGSPLCSSESERSLLRFPIDRAGRSGGANSELGMEWVKIGKTVCHANLRRARQSYVSPVSSGEYEFDDKDARLTVETKFATPQCLRQSVCAGPTVLVTMARTPS